MSRAASRWDGVLWTPDGKARALPTVAAFDAALARRSEGDDTLRDHFFSVIQASNNPLGVDLWHIPTFEWIDGLAAWITTRGHKRVLEVGAGDGFVAHLLRRRLSGFVEVAAQDDRSWDGATRTLYPPVATPSNSDERKGFTLRCAREFKPTLILWIWAPMDAAGADKLVRLADEYLLVGEDRGGCTGGWPGTRVARRVRDERLEGLDTVARCRTDHSFGFVMRHTCHALFRSKFVFVSGEASSRQAKYREKVWVDHGAVSMTERPSVRGEPSAPCSRGPLQADSHGPRRRR